MRDHKLSRLYERDTMYVKPYKLQFSKVNGYYVVDKNGKVVVDIEDMEASRHEAQNIVDALNDFRAPSRFERSIVAIQRNNLLRGIETAIRKARSMYLVPELDGSAMYGEYSLCTTHNIGQCPPFDLDMNQSKPDLQCSYDLNRLVLNLANGQKHYIDISLMIEKENMNGNENVN